MHGWMGDKTEWDMATYALVKELSDEWGVISIDLPARGDSPLLFTADEQIIQDMFGSDFENSASIDNIAASMLMPLQNEHKVTNLDAIAEYSLGGRVAMAMMKYDATDHAQLCQDKTAFKIIEFKFKYS